MDEYETNQDDNEYNGKPMHGSQLPNSVNGSGSAEKLENERNNLSNTGFNFLQPNGRNICFNVDGGEIEEIYENLKNQCKFIICILMKDDTYFSGTLLEKTFDAIKNNISGLKKLLKPENLLICVFFNEIKSDSIFNEEEFYNNNLPYILSQKSYFIEEQIINVHCISKRSFLSDIEILKLFYSLIIKQMKINKNIIFTSVITAGVSPYQNSFETFIKLSYNKKNNHSIIVPCIDESEDDNIIYKIRKYERVHFNIYNMNFYDMSASVPISSLYNVMAIDDNLFHNLINFYQQVNIDEYIDYHDYNLSLYLYRNNHRIIYYNSSAMANIMYPSLEENPICNYKNLWVTRYAGYYGNFFNILYTFIDFNVYNIIHKIFSFFLIIGLIIEFIFPSLFTMVIYTIFFEAFGTEDRRPAVFCSLLYLFMFICSGACSLISKNSKRMILTNLFFYFFMEVYYLFILICSIIAMDNVKKNKKRDSYKFNTAAIVCIIIFTFIPAIIPMLLKVGIIIENIVPMLLYLVMGAPASTSSFLIAQVLNSAETSGGEFKKERKGIIIIGYFLTNLFFGSLTFYNYNRKKRVEAVMGLGIFYLLYNFFKIAAIALNILTNSKNLNTSNNIDKDFFIELGLESSYLRNSANSNMNQNNEIEENNDDNVYHSQNGEYEPNDQVNNNNINVNVNDNDNNNVNNEEYPSKSQIDNYQNNSNNNNENNNNDNYNDNNEGVDNYL